MADTLVTFNGKTIAGPNGISVLIDFPVLPTPAANTLRFDFSDRSYSPVVAGVGQSGTWTKLSHPFNNIWDWTNNNTNWTTAFGSSSSSAPGAFVDYNNNKVKVIAAGDTSTVVNLTRLFQNCLAITDICVIDTSGCTNMVRTFFNCPLLKAMPLFDTSNVTDMRYFMSNSKLTSIPLFDTSKVTNMEGTFMHCHELTTVPLLDLSNVTTIEGIFLCCESLRTVPNFVITKSCNMERIFDMYVEGTQRWYDSKLTVVPNWDWSKATSLSRAFRGCKSLTTIPTMNISSSITKVDEIFAGCENVESGALALYNVLSQISSITDHTDAFKNCGINTVTGRAELEQIPESWGGLLMPVSVSVRFKFYASGDEIYDPTEEQWEKGEWTKIEEVPEEYAIWEWSYNGTDASRAFYGKFNDFYIILSNVDIVNISCTSRLTNVSEMFAGCKYIENGITLAYNSLSSINPTHTNCFDNCGIATKSGAQSLTSIPAESWGGLKPAQGKGIQIGDYVWDTGIITDLINIPELRKLGSEEEYQAGDIVYYEINGIPRYSPVAIQYMIDHPEVLPNGWHIPTLAEAQSLDLYAENYSITSIVRTTGLNGFGMEVDDEGKYDKEWPAIKNDGYLTNIVRTYPTKVTGPWHIETYRYNDYPSETIYLCNGGSMMISVDYGGSIYVDVDDYSTETNYLYPVRLVKDHD